MSGSPFTKGWLLTLHELKMVLLYWIGVRKCICQRFPLKEEEEGSVREDSNDFFNI